MTAPGGGGGPLPTIAYPFKTGIYLNCSIRWRLPKHFR